MNERYPDSHSIPATSKRIRCSDLCMDLSTREVTLQGAPLALTDQEFALLRTLVQYPNQVLSRNQLLQDAWGYVTPTRTVDMFIARLRHKLGAKRIDTVYRVGYRFNVC